MQIVRNLGMGLLGASLTGCANAPASPLLRDVDFVRGCWVEKNAQDHRIDALLRLLPDGSEYAGRLEYVRGIRPGPEIRVSVARDGTSASVTRNGERFDLPAEITASSGPGDVSRRIVFSGTTNGRYARIEVTGKSHGLAMTILDGVSMLAFDGERDGCD